MTLNEGVFMGDRGIKGIGRKLKENWGQGWSNCHLRDVVCVLKGSRAKFVNISVIKWETGRSAFFQTFSFCLTPRFY